MKALVILVLAYVLFSEEFQASTALRCYSCTNTTCTQQITCNSTLGWCFTNTTGNTLTKGCTNNASCPVPPAVGITCCQYDLCNSVDGFNLSLLIMVVPLISPIFFI